jgi:circadian clock protein KaiB
MSIRLLYVEDDDDLRRMVGMMLTNEGYDVVAVSNAEDAVMELQRERYDLLLTDYNLPNKNADWMLKMAEATGSLRDTAVVVLTATLNPEGVDGYRILRKPADVSVLFAALDEAAGTRQDVSSAASAAAEAADGVLRLTLYVTGGSRDSKKAIRNLSRVLKKLDAARVRLDVHDVASAELSPELLEEDRIVVTPTLVRAYPLPKVWVFGDLSNIDLLEEMISPGGMGAAELNNR